MAELALEFLVASWMKVTLSASVYFIFILDGWHNNGVVTWWSETDTVCNAFLVCLNLDHINENPFTGVVFSIAILGHLIQRLLAMEGLVTEDNINKSLIVPAFEVFLSLDVNHTQWSHRTLKAEIL